MIRCFGCNVGKDMNILEASPFAEEDGLTDDPIEPLFVLDCEGHSEFRMVVVCHKCFHALSPDMWISKNGWESINPTIPYDKLPMYADELRDNPTLVAQKVEK